MLRFPAELFEHPFALICLLVCLAVRPQGAGLEKFVFFLKSEDIDTEKQVKNQRSSDVNTKASDITLTRSEKFPLRFLTLNGPAFGGVRFSLSFRQASRFRPN